LATFADLLTAAREGGGLSQYALAKRAGLSKQALSLLELGRREPSWETVQKLALALGVDYGAFADPDMTLPPKGPPARRGRPPAKPPDPDPYYLMPGWGKLADGAILKALADGKPRTVVQLGSVIQQAVPLDVLVRFYLKERDQQARSRGRAPSGRPAIAHCAMMGARRIAANRLAALRKRPSVRIEITGPAGDRSYRLVR
jgi:transcriptional regulator with XRE-family HTH domain